MAAVNTTTVLRGNVAARLRIGNPAAAIAFGLLGLILALGIVVPIVAGSGDVAQQNPSLLSPSLDHPFGTDRYGRDVFLRCMAAARIDIAIGVAYVLINTTLEFVYGWVDPRVNLAEGS